MAAEINLRKSWDGRSAYHFYGLCFLARILRGLLYFFCSLVCDGVSSPNCLQDQQKLPCDWRVFRDDRIRREGNALAVCECNVLKRRNLLYGTIAKNKLEYHGSLQVRTSSCSGHPNNNSTPVGPGEKERRKESPHIIKTKMIFILNASIMNRGPCSGPAGNFRIACSTIRRLLVLNCLRLISQSLRLPSDRSFQSTGLSCCRYFLYRFSLKE